VFPGIRKLDSNTHLTRGETCASCTVDRVLVVYAYPDVFGVYGTGVLDAALDGKAAATVFTVSQKVPDFHVKEDGHQIGGEPVTPLDHEPRTSSPPGPGNGRPLGSRARCPMQPSEPRRA
jgi:hypothetical protein